uniref:Ig-like domain-containing protein n=1 Tax=Sphaeramia orbicularis TaxID=375764 RepID=A0A673CNG4_9TELE
SLLPAGPLNAAVGGNVLFKTKLDPTPLQSIIWGFGTVGTIITSTSTEDTITPGYEGRLTVNTSTGSLELRNVSTDDSGIYTVTIIPQTGRMVNIKPVYFPSTVPVSNVKITTSSTDLMEFSSVRLSCSSSGSSLSFRWFNDSSEVTADRVQITDGGSTMTIVSVTRYDQGPFKCFVSNLVSDGTSDPVTFTISYGPENVTLKVSPSQKHHPEGSDVTLSCSAVSEPTAEFTWFCNGVLQSGTGPEFRLMNIQMNHSGSYSCQAFNNSNMHRLEVTVYFPSTVPVSNVKITTSSTDLMEFSSVRLSCSSSGSSPSFHWFNDSSEVTADRVQITDGGSTMTIVNVTRYDQGPFRCSVSNLVSNGTSDPVTFTISYGPYNVKISGPTKLEKGKNLELKCIAESVPYANYTWIRDGERILNNSDMFIKQNVQTSATYTCEAKNSVTGRLAYGEHHLTVKVTVCSVRLSCSSSGSSPSFRWFNDSSEVTADRVQITDRRSTMTIVSVTRYDQGPFKCFVSNLVSDGTSDPVTFTISYGPENVTLKVSPSQKHHPEGSDVTLSCSAVSEPTAEFTWFFNGVLQSGTGPEFRLMNIQMNHSGSYSCQAFNSKTMRNETSQPLLISVLSKFVKGHGTK